MHVGGYLNPDEFWAMVREGDELMRRSGPHPPAYELVEWGGPRSIHEWDYGDGVRAILHGDPDDAMQPRVMVRSGDTDRRWAVASLRTAPLSFQPGDDSWPRLTEAARDVPPDGLVEITVGETPVMFEQWTDGDRWWAAGDCADHTIVIESRGVAPERIALRVMQDIEPLIAARNAWVARMRGEELPPG